MTSQFSPPNPFARFRDLLGENRDLVLVFISTQLADLFGSTHEALLDFAERAESNLVRGQFVQAEETIRRKRGEVEHLFRQEISDGFDRLLKPRPVEPPKKPGTLDAPELSLVEPDELEETVAIANLVGAAKSNYYSQLYAISQRLSVVNFGRKLDEPEIPAGPTRLVEAFRNALRPLTLDIKSKLILYAMLDKFVMRQLKDVYDEFNGNLKSAGILPNLKPVAVPVNRGRSGRQPGRDVKDPQAPQPGAAPGDASAESPAMPGGPGGREDAALGAELFDGILSLMARSQGRASSPSPGAGRGVRSAAQGEGYQTPAQAAVHQEVLSVLNQVQPTSIQQAISPLGNLDDLPNIAVDPAFVSKIKAVIHQEQDQIFARIPREKMAGIDSDTIDLIGMLFEYMLNDPVLPNVAKALLSHLHTPYLKLALLARDLLVDSEHPARLLLDLLVEAGGQWVFESDVKRGIFPKIQGVVDRVLREPTTVALFTDLLKQFTAAVDEYRRKADAVENRAKETMQGKERLQMAKNRAAMEIQKLVSRTPLPSAVGQFLIQTWADRLVFILLRHPEGDQSDSWRRAIQIADDLVWLFEPKLSDAERSDLVRVCGLLEEEVQYGLGRLGGYHQHYVDEVLSLLQNPDRLLGWSKSSPADSVFHVPSEAAPPAASPAPAAAGEAHQRAETKAPEDLRTPTTPTPSQPQKEPSLDPAQIREREMLEKVQHLQFGTWFEFEDTESAARRRLKLSWLSPMSSTCMFVDRSGLQAEIKPLIDLVRMLIAGTARIVPKPRHSFVESALRAIKKALQRKVESI